MYVHIHVGACMHANMFTLQDVHVDALPIDTEIQKVGDIHAHDLSVHMHMLSMTTKRMRPSVLCARSKFVMETFLSLAIHCSCCMGCDT